MTIERKVTVGALLVAPAGIVIQILGKADYPGVPPGAIIMAVGAGLFALRNVWANIVAMLGLAMITVGGVLTPNVREQLSAPSDVLIFLGTAIQVVAMLTALVLGSRIILRGLRSRKPVAA